MCRGLSKEVYTIINTPKERSSRKPLGYLLFIQRVKIFERIIYIYRCIGKYVWYTLEETLVREVREESGLIVKKDSIKEFGYVRRIEKGRIEDIFVQENFYYLCDVEDVLQMQELDDYEEEEMFTLEYVRPEYAIGVNENSDYGEKVKAQTFQGMIERENRVLLLVRKESLK